MFSDWACDRWTTLRGTSSICVSKILGPSKVQLVRRRSAHGAYLVQKRDCYQDQEYMTGTYYLRHNALPMRLFMSNRFSKGSALVGGRTHCEGKHGHRGALITEYALLMNSGRELNGGMPLYPDVRAGWKERPEANWSAEEPVRRNG